MDMVGDMNLDISPEAWQNMAALVVSLNVRQSASLRWLLAPVPKRFEPDHPTS